MTTLTTTTSASDTSKKRINQTTVTWVVRLSRSTWYCYCPWRLPVNDDARVKVTSPMMLTTVTGTVCHGRQRATVRKLARPNPLYCAKAQRLEQAAADLEAARTRRRKAKKNKSSKKRRKAKHSKQESSDPGKSDENHESASSSESSSSDGEVDDLDPVLALPVLRFLLCVISADRLALSLLSPPLLATLPHTYCTTACQQCVDRPLTGLDPAVVASHTDFFMRLSVTARGISLRNECRQQRQFLQCSV
jgi:hypothetical protein